jgi:nitroreductase
MPPTSATQQALTALLTRYSVGPRWLVAPGPSPQELLQAAQAALRAPDHGRMIPWRAVVIDEAQRPALAALFEQFAREAGKSDEDVAAERERARNGPVLVAWIVRIDTTVDKVPPHEQWLCAGGALSNFMTALHLLGYGAKALGGRKCSHPALTHAFCEDGEELVAFICIGTPTRLAQPREADQPGHVLSSWQPR